MDTYYTSPKQDEIMEFLFKVRGANVDQITKALNMIKSSATVIDDTLIKNTYGILKKLEKYGLIEFFSYKLEIKSRERRLYQLSKKGLMEFYRKRKVKENTVASGYFEEYGFIKHALYTPPKRSMAHHLMTVDAMIDVYILTKHNQGKLDFANNLFVAQKSIKPDFGVKTKKNYYLIEIDRSNERGQSLQNKFTKYNNHFRTLKSEGKELPAAIFFVVPDAENTNGVQSHHKKIRFQSIANVFVKECKEFLEEINLYFLELKLFYSKLIEEINQFSQKKLNEYQIKLEKQGIIVDFVNGNLVVFESNEKKKVIGVYASIEGNQIKPWIFLGKELKDLNKFNNSDQILSFMDIEDIKVLSFKEIPNIPEFIENKERFKILSCKSCLPEKKK